MALYYLCILWTSMVLYDMDPLWPYGPSVRIHFNAPILTCCCGRHWVQIKRGSPDRVQWSRGEGRGVQRGSGSRGGQEGVQSGSRGSGGPKGVQRASRWGLEGVRSLLFYSQVVSYCTYDAIVSNLVMKRASLWNTKLCRLPLEQEAATVFII